MELTLELLKVQLDTVWVLFSAFLVFWMNAGFALVESGLCRAKNCVNILAKNYIVFAVSTIAFFAVGFGLMFGNGNGFTGLTGFFPHLTNGSASFSSLDWTSVPMAAKFFFQLVFAGTAATIVSGAVAERIKFSAFIVFSIIMTAVLYPIAGHWIWGGGFLGAMGFHDFAGSTVVHSIGGWAALTGAMLLGARLGKYKDGRAMTIRGHNMTNVTLGGLILWLGWFGFNPGSTMAADGNAIAHIAITTNLAAAAGSVTALLMSWRLQGKPDLGMIINGTLAGLVAVTAGCDAVSMTGALVIGGIAGVLAVGAVFFFDKMRIDDPVGALSVHLVNGVWGTLAVGLFATKAGSVFTGADGLFYGGGLALLQTQAIGVAAVAAFVLLGSALAWMVIGVTFGMRVSAVEELEGLDIGEHGMPAYVLGTDSPIAIAVPELHAQPLRNSKKILQEPALAHHQ